MDFYDPRFSPPARDWSPRVDRAVVPRARFDDFAGRDHPGGPLRHPPDTHSRPSHGLPEFYGLRGPDGHEAVTYFDRNWLRHTPGQAGLERVPNADAISRAPTSTAYGRSHFSVASLDSASLVGGALILLVVLLAFVQIGFIVAATRLLWVLASSGAAVAANAK